MALVDAVSELPGLCPAAATLAALARERDVAATVRCDPGAVVFLAQHQVPLDSFDIPLKSLDDAFLLSALQVVEHCRLPFVDWRRPGCDRVWRASQTIASTAEALARLTGVSPGQAFAAGLLAPLGWLGVCAARPDAVPESGWDHATLARRLVRSWRLPAWLADVVGHLDWTIELVARLGADARLATVVQLAIVATEKADRGLGLTVGTKLDELLERLHLTEDAASAAVGETIVNATVPAFENPTATPLLADVLRLTVENRQRREATWIAQLNRDIDRLEATLLQQIADEEKRLAKQKLAALAEFAGGAGHEINNPLAVISGQAQYILKQMLWAEELLLEDPTPAAVLEAIKFKLTKPLQMIVGQSQRIHQVITDLMQFARPQPPRLAIVPVTRLVAEAAAALRPLAEERRVRLVCPEPPAHLAVRADAGQIRLALANLLRNGIEAASADGWASLRVERETNGNIGFTIEDNGPGVPEHQREHVFDPFYSGRSAGRGRGLGLSTAWRLAKQHGGDVVLDAAAQGVTRFLLLLPATAVIDNYVPAANGKRETIGYQLPAAVG